VLDECSGHDVWLVASVSAFQAVEPVQPLETLIYRMGWVPLGDLTGDEVEWAVGSDPTVDYMTAL
jgi:hypothetical protein